MGFFFDVFFWTFASRNWWRAGGIFLWFRVWSSFSAKFKAKICHGKKNIALLRFANLNRKFPLVQKWIWFGFFFSLVKMWQQLRVLKDNKFTLTQMVSFLAKGCCALQEVAEDLVRTFFLAVSDFRGLHVFKKRCFEVEMIKTLGTSLWLVAPITPGKNPTILENLSTFFHIWPLGQWIGSLVGLVLLYVVTGHYYNKWLQHWGGWLDWKTRCWLIAVDLGLNFIIGLYYMNYRETAMGALMMTCPIAISPLIFILELAAMIAYRRYVSKNTKK